MMSNVSMIKVFFGSFFMQSSWSFEKMQALGFAAAISPALDEIYDDPKARTEAYKRELQFYNAHPYMASPVLGASIRLEEKVRDGVCPADAPANFKRMIMSPYGAIGDGFFWGSVRPLASCIGVLAALLWGMWGPAVFLVVYNVFHIWMRWHGLKKGYELGTDVIGYIKSLELPLWSVRFKDAASAVLGAVAAFLVIKALSLISVPGTGLWKWGAAGVGAAVVLALLLNMTFKKGLTVPRLFYLVVAPLILLGVIY